MHIFSIMLSAFLAAGALSYAICRLADQYEELKRLRRQWDDLPAVRRRFVQLEAEAARATQAALVESEITAYLNKRPRV